MQFKYVNRQDLERKAFRFPAKQDRILNLVPAVRMPSSSVVYYTITDMNVPGTTYFNPFSMSPKKHIGRHDIVVVQNLINLVPNFYTLFLFMMDAASLIMEDGFVLVDYPKHKRFMRCGVDKMREFLDEVFPSVNDMTVSGHKEPIWQCRLLNS